MPVAKVLPILTLETGGITAVPKSGTADTLQVQALSVCGELSATSAGLSIPGIGLLAATAMVAANSGKVAHFKDARHFASWLDLTPEPRSQNVPCAGRDQPVAKTASRGIITIAQILRNISKIQHDLPTTTDPQALVDRNVFQVRRLP
jgi:hypothetical protein